jgi:predicted nucleic acid-binding protein
VKFVVDANVAIKWYVDHADSPAAMQIADSDAELLAPDLIYAEVANALWKYVRVKQIKLADAGDALTALPTRFDAIVGMDSLADDALQIANELNHTVYDCFYLVLARREKAPLVTADKRLAVAVQSLSDVEVQLIAAA